MIRTRRYAFQRRGPKRLQILAEMLVVIPIDRRDDPARLQTDAWVTATGVIVILLGILAWRRSVAALAFACVLFAGQLVLYFALHPSFYLLWSGLFPMTGFVWLLLPRSAARWSCRRCGCLSGGRCARVEPVA